MTTQFLNNKKTITGHAGAIYDIVTVDEYLLTASADHFVAEWDVNEGKQTNFAVKLERSSYNIDYSPKNNQILIGTNNGDLHLVDIEKREEIKRIDHHKKSVFAVKYSSYNNYYYTGDKEGICCVWDGDSLELLVTLPFGCGKIREIAESEDGKHIAICGQDGFIRIIETNFFNVIEEIKINNDGVNCALFDGDYIYIGGKDAFISKWNWKEKKRIKNIPAHNYAVYDLEFFENKSKIVSVSFDKTVKLWNAKDFSIIERIEHKNGGHRHVVNRIAKMNESTFATISDDRKIKIWEIVAK